MKPLRLTPRRLDPRSRRPFRLWDPLWTGLGLLLVTACGAIPTTTGTVSIPANLGGGTTVALPTPTPQPTATSLITPVRTPGFLNVPTEQLTLLAQKRGDDLVVSLPDKEVSRWLAQSNWPGVEGIDVTLVGSNYRQTASAQLRLGQPALFTFANPPPAGEITASAYAGTSNTLAQGKLTLDLSLGSDRVQPLSLTVAPSVPLLQGVQNLTSDAGTVLRSSTDLSLVLTGQNLDQVSRVLIATGDLIPANRSIQPAEIQDQTAKTLTIKLPLGLPTRFKIAVANRAGLGLGSLTVNGSAGVALFPSPQPSPTVKAQASPSPMVSPSPSPVASSPVGQQWQVETLPLLQDASFPDRLTLSQPVAVVSDPAGNYFIADRGQHRIFRLTPAGELTVWAGRGTAGWKDGDAAQAQFNTPLGLAFDLEGNLLVADGGNHRIRLITPAGQVSTVAGGALPGSADGSRTQARFRQPQALIVGSDGTIWVADSGDHRIRQISPEGQVSTLAGTGQAGDADGSADQAQFNTPSDLALDAQKRLWIADTGNHRIRLLTPAGQVSTVAGSIAGFADGDLAQFDSPIGLALTAAGHLLIADAGNHRIRELTVSESVQTAAGNDRSGLKDGAASEAQFVQPTGLWMQADGSLIVADRSSPQLRRLVWGRKDPVGG